MPKFSSSSLPQLLGLTVVVALITSAVATQLFLRAASETQPSSPAMETVRETIRRSVREESKIIAAVEEGNAAVVSVIVTKDLPVIEQYFEEGRSPFDGFNFFFGDQFNSPFNFRVPQYRQNGTEKKEVGGGTAFFISRDGLLLTNKHVVDDEEAEYTVLLNDGEKLEAEVVARDPGNDIALLKVSGEDYSFLKIGSDELQLGQTVIAIGNALAEFRNTVSVGVISGLKRSVTASTGFGKPAEELESIIQTDAAINRGNSGGPLLNTAGEVVGMNTAVASGAQNIGFAIPASDLLRALESYLEHGEIQRAFLGIRYMQITEELAEKNNLDYDYGVLIARGEERDDLAVIPGSPADKAGLLENDIILEIDGEKLTRDNSLAAMIRRKGVGESVELKVVRKGEERVVSITLEGA